ncbi:hypothetical protein DCAR_0417483 [Daucus carota subsp. sativus]|uniref:J domain-containing protein n=1 Tax=Daucus carota subsp. sativus TaxID=79200 RepID=A0AAF0WYG2_DAUCS|nr:PREDICTED: uncharacterized protein LOC108216057 [Daucus carota subsp. sativus]WOG98142.1 hypothetical protein DCAR_0417483 [Daucus carota subsp. sativus]
MNRATKAVISSIQATQYNLKSTALFHSTPVLQRKRRSSPWDTRGSASKGSTRRAKYYRYSGKQNRKEELLRNVSAFAENLFQGLNYDYEEYEREPSSSRGRTWFRPDFRDKGSKAGGSNYKGPRSGRRRGFQFCEDDDDVENLFQSAFGGNKHYFWSFMSDEPPRSSSGYSYNSRYSSRWKWTHEEDYDTDADRSESESNSTSDRKTLGLSATGPLNADDVKIAYRKCAMKWHPDRHQGSSKAVAEEKFKVCSAAYQSLCDKLALN